MTEKVNHATRCGYVAIVGRPNVGKSTLLNHILEKKISITSRRPQTTRHQILGVATDGDVQVVYVDTPGMHVGRKSALNRYMNRAAESALQMVDVVLFMVEACKWTPDDTRVLNLIQSVNVPVILLVNKVDILKNKEALLPFLAQCQEKMDFKTIYPLCARKRAHMEDLVKTLKPMLPEGPFFFPPEQITDRSEAFLVTEIIREKIMRTLGEELPYVVTVTLDRCEKQKDTWHLHGIIWVEREGQKAIVIGDGGERLREMSTQARKDIEQFLGEKVFLRLWVKVKSHWSDDEAGLADFGYDE